MTEQHPINLDSKTIHRLSNGYFDPRQEGVLYDSLNRIAQWGWGQREPEIQSSADAELDACCEWLSFHHYPGLAQRLRVVRRPKPPSEADQALAALGRAPKDGAPTITVDVDQFDAITRALRRMKEMESANG